LGVVSWKVSLELGASATLVITEKTIGKEHTSTPAHHDDDDHMQGEASPATQYQLGNRGVQILHFCSATSAVTNVLQGRAFSGCSLT
jgi:hypothetical protein